MKTPTVEILSQGEEVLTGQIVDTNSAWLSERLVKLGFTVTRHNTVGDRLEDLINVFQETTRRADVCICTGGLGPTSDDLTAQAVSEAFDLALIEDPVALEQIEQYFSSRQKVMPAINRRQALLPQGAIRLDNHWGTAPGFSLQVTDCRLICIPGVPYEMRQLFDTQIVILLEQHFQQKPWQLVILRTVNIGESDIQQRIQQIALPKSVTLSFRADLWENQTKLLFPPDYSYQNMDELTQLYRQAIGESVFSIDGLKQPGGSLVEVVGRLLKQRKATVSLLETVSSGKLAAHCAGACWLDHAITVFRAHQLSDMYDVNCDQLNSFRQLSSAATSIAKQLCDQTGSDYSLVQLWAIRSGLELLDNEAIPIVTVAFGPDEQCLISEVNVLGPMRRRHTRAAVTALDLLCQLLLKDDCRI
ncbi:MAG: competence/damage-inducible protein A [Methylococcales bacterium]